ncbi:MAG: hypothetical protein QW096_10245 [Thermofilaceae archaeon]
MILNLCLTLNNVLRRQHGCNVILVIAGFVGAGKTTISSVAKAYFAKQNLSTCYDSLTAFPVLSYAFFRMLGMICYGSKVLNYYESIKVHPSTLLVKRIIKFPKIIKLIILVMEIFSLILRLLILLLRSRGRDIIIIDEGFINIIANYIEILNKEAIYLTYMLVSIVNIISKKFKIYTFFLKTNLKVLSTRWKRRGYPKTTSLIDRTHHIYYNLFLLNIARNIYGQYFHVIDLDANKGLPEMVCQIVSQVSCQQFSKDLTL